MGSGALLSLCFIWYGKKPCICASINYIWLIFFGCAVHQLLQCFIFSGVFQSEADLHWSCSWKVLLIQSASLIIFPLKKLHSVQPRWDEAVFAQKTYFKLSPSVLKRRWLTCVGCLKEISLSLFTGNNIFFLDEVLCYKDIIRHSGISSDKNSSMFRSWHLPVLFKSKTVVAVSCHTRCFFVVMSFLKSD